MKIETIHLKDFYPLLGADGRDPLLTCYMPNNQNEPHRRVKKHRTMIVCPGGGYEFVSEREAEPVVLSLLPMDFYVFVLTYSVVPHTHPAQVQEMAATFDLLYGAALAKHHIPFEMHIYPEGDHGLAVCSSVCIDSMTDEIAYAAQWVPALQKRVGTYFRTAAEE